MDKEIVIRHEISLRDYFAIQALVGLLSNSHLVESLIRSENITARIAINLNTKCAFEYADAMLAEREKIK